MWLTPPERVTLDIETVAGDPSSAEAVFRWSFTADSRWKPETIGERYLKGLEEKKQKLALLDDAPIITVALRTPADCRVLHWLDVADPVFAGVPLERYPSEREMLLGVRGYLESIGPETILVGHNLRHFDLPKLRRAYLRHGMRLPRVLVTVDHPTFDTMLAWRAFSVEDRAFFTLAECLEAAGIPNHKGYASGRDIPDLWLAGDYRTILAYAIADVLAEDSLYLRMTGQIEDQPVLSGVASEGKV